jgi:hypothetical protein
MPSLKSFISAALLCLVVTSCVASAKADATYTYRGNLFFGRPDQGECFLIPPSACTHASIDGSFTLASQLADNLTNVFVKPASFSFESAGLSDDNTNTPPASNPTFEVSTNALGDVDFWNIAFGDASYSFPVSPRQPSLVEVYRVTPYLPPFPADFSTTPANPGRGLSPRRAQTCRSRGTELF